MKPPTPFAGTSVSPARLISFSDGIFAIAITLLVFNLKVPTIPEAQVHRQLVPTIVAMLPHFLTYVISFLLIAVFWSIHHHILNLVLHIDGRFIWINMAYLLLISFLPFPSALLGAYPEELFSMLFYLACMSGAGLMLMAMLAYAGFRRRLVRKDLSAIVIRHYFYRGLSSQVVFLVAAGLACYQLSWGKLSLLILVPIQAWLARHYKLLLAAEQARSSLPQDTYQ